MREIVELAERHAGVSGVAVGEGAVEQRAGGGEIATAEGDLRLHAPQERAPAGRLLVGGDAQAAVGAGLRFVQLAGLLLRSGEVGQDPRHQQRAAELLRGGECAPILHLRFVEAM